MFHKLFRSNVNQMKRQKRLFWQLSVIFQNSFPVCNGPKICSLVDFSLQFKHFGVQGKARVEAP